VRISAFTQNGIKSIVDLVGLFNPEQHPARGYYRVCW
jgi:hypothetical protein